MEQKRAQLIKKDCSTGEYGDIFPITTVQSVEDAETGRNLESILDDTNHIYLPFVGFSKAETRLQVIPEKRRRGLWITYVSCKNKVVTEYYNSNDFSDEAWKNNDNWVPYFNKELVTEIVKEVLSWYKA